MRSRIAAQSWASVPPLPAWISMKQGLGSIGLWNIRRNSMSSTVRSSTSTSLATATSVASSPSVRASSNSSPLSFRRASRSVSVPTTPSSCFLSLPSSCARFGSIQTPGLPALLRPPRGALPWRRSQRYLPGPAQELGIEMRAGAMAYFQAVNAAGGVNGRKIELRSLDDGYEGDRAAANTKKLIEDGVFLLFGYVGTPTSNASKPIFTAARVPFVGPFTGAESLRNPLNRYIFNIRASYYDETDKLVGQLVGQTLDRIAVFYQNDDYGKAGLAGVERAMHKRNMKVLASGTVERNT